MIPTRRDGVRQKGGLRGPRPRTTGHPIEDVPKDMLAVIGDVRARVVQQDRPLLRAQRDIDDLERVDRAHREQVVVADALDVVERLRMVMVEVGPVVVEALTRIDDVLVTTRFDESAPSVVLV